MHKPENESDEEYKDELKKIIYRGTFEKEDDTTVLQRFMYSFNADIWGSSNRYVPDFCRRQRTRKS